jgi:hypothetical protein
MDSGANIHMCADVSMFSSYQVERSGALLMGNGLCRNPETRVPLSTV